MTGPRRAFSKLCLPPTAAPAGLPAFDSGAHCGENQIMATLIIDPTGLKG